jgi:hypothetical protein
VKADDRLALSLVTHEAAHAGCVEEAAGRPMAIDYLGAGHGLILCADAQDAHCVLATDSPVVYRRLPASAPQLATQNGTA